MKKRLFSLVVCLFFSILVLSATVNYRPQASENGNGAKVRRVGATRAALQASRQPSRQAERPSAGSRLEDFDRSVRAIVSVDSIAAKVSRNQNGTRIVIGPLPVVQRISQGRARAAGWVLY